ncbi:MAG: hypothetical protein ACFCAD_03395 [Pleurocapsa sp.]
MMVVQVSNTMPNDSYLKPNVSLVAFYGDKPSPLQSLIQQLQSYLASQEAIRDRFIPYQLEQVHGTIIGCEGSKTKSEITSQWFYECRQEIRSIDLEGVVNYLQHQVNLPLTIRFGGYDRNQEYNFVSRDEHLYFRSFQLQPVENQLIPILIGWSWQNNKVNLAIDNLRRSFQKFNLLHKYHATPDGIDNDFYLRLGTIDSNLSAIEIKAIATNVRNLLEAQPALHISINKKDLAFVQYQDLFLIPRKTKVIPISKITAKDLNQIYPPTINMP